MKEKLCREDKLVVSRIREAFPPWDAVGSQGLENLVSQKSE